MKIIAEFCQNHNGDIDILKDMVVATSEAGATYAKIQTIFADDLVNEERFNRIRPYQKEYERFKSLELDWDAHKLFLKECKKFNLIPMTTSFLPKYLPKLKKLGFNHIKVASVNCAIYPLINEVVNNFDNIFVSTGATYYDELLKTVDILKQKQNYALLHCITKYPTPREDLNLRRILYLKELAPYVGYSDHTTNVDACVVAKSLGVDVIEKHFTILDKSKTWDGKISMNPEELKTILELDIDDIREVEEMLGEYRPCMTSEEAKNIEYYRGRFK